MWNTSRIEADKKLIDMFGLKNEKELWRVQTELSRIRSNVRLLLSQSDSENSRNVSNNIINRLVRYNIASEGTNLEKLLDLDETAFLERRLQSIVFRKGLANSMKQSRQLIVHGFISVNGRKVNKPSYLVPASEDSKIGYYKPVNLNINKAEESEPKEEAKESSDKVAEEVKE